MDTDKVSVTNERMHKLQAYVSSYKLPLFVKIWKDRHAVEKNSPDIYTGDCRTIMDNVSNFCGLFYIDGYMEISVMWHGEEFTLFHFDCDEDGTFIPCNLAVNKMLDVIS